MKSIKLMLATALLAGFSFTSCSDDDGGSSTGGNIVGKWTPTKTVTSVNGRNDSKNYADNEPGCDKDYTEFVTGGQVKEVVFFKNASSVCTEDAQTGSTWSKADTTLIINSQSYEITRLTGSELTIKSTVTTGGATLSVTEYYNRVN